MVRRNIIIGLSLLLLIWCAPIAHADNCILKKMENFSIKQAEFHSRMMEFKDAQKPGDFDFIGWGKILQEWGELLDEWGIILENISNDKCCDYYFFNEAGEKLCVTLN